MRRYGNHKDTAHKPVVIALRAAGASVQDLDGQDIPDLLVGFAGVNYLMEVKTTATNTRKDGYGRTTSGKASAGQEEWHREWRGTAVLIVRQPADALAALGVDVEKIEALRVATSNWTRDPNTPEGKPKRQRPFRYGTDKARTLAESCKREFCATSAVLGSNPPRCAAHAAEETFSP